VSEKEITGRVRPARIKRGGSGVLLASSAAVRDEVKRLGAAATASGLETGAVEGKRRW
jgi:hypothetical protein